MSTSPHCSQSVSRFVDESILRFSSINCDYRGNALTQTRKKFSYIK